MKYSTVMISKVIKGIDGTERLYKARKMSSMTVAKEGFKLLKSITPSIGAGVDSMVAQQTRESLFEDGQAHTFGAMMQLLSENISDEHFEDLSMRLLGSLMLGDDEIKDLDKHFDEFSGDFIEILWWLGKENFANFIMGSGTLVSLMSQLTDLMSPTMKDAIESVKNSLSTASSTE